uniref:non-specific serine/threonine protein kinase n=1 Tax=Tetraselmis sp. GSL018 TaxID=582737 RepID=A0A061RPT8_9CHLO|mmetsp:Transcript_39740/g.94379  ORF Transcript_39740/g.94379 Transcript_39740/m.94379 type:complete len:471 (+) Transcript_39740:173-1585(+)
MVQVLDKVTGNITDTYAIRKVLGKGQFGTTRLATHMATGQDFACKTINKKKLTSKDDVEDVRREISIMKHLDHPNIVRLKEAYEDRDHVHIVMEVCTGGELFDRIVERGHYSEKDAADLVRTMVQVVKHCHERGVMHRDLKPENFLLASRDANSAIKATDFGLSVYFKPGDYFRDIVGSAYYVAPEVLRKRYGHQADIWSIGVILYILLCGVPPFWGDTEQQIFDSVLKGKLDFATKPWPSISSAAKDLVKRMLVMDPTKRATIKEILEDEWLKENGSASSAPLDESVISRIKNFSNLNRLKKEALRVIATSLAPSQVMELNEIFKKIDTDKSGTITVEEMRAALASKFQGTSLEKELTSLMEAADVDGDGTIDYSEFLASTVQQSSLETDENLQKAFEHFDTDMSGYITIDELTQGLKSVKMLDVDAVEGIIEEVDKDGDGKINYEEFAQMMRSKQEEQLAKLSTRGKY